MGNHTFKVVKQKVKEENDQYRLVSIYTEGMPKHGLFERCQIESVGDNKIMFIAAGRQGAEDITEYFHQLTAISKPFWK